MTDSFGSDYLIKAAQQTDIAALQTIELSAAHLFSQTPYQELAQGEPISSDRYHHYFDAGFPIWIGWSLDNGLPDRPAGFALTLPLDGDLHLQEISVHANHQRRGLGGWLLRHVLRFAKGKGYHGVTLTTYRSIAWNGPFYTKHGFAELTDGEMSKSLGAILKKEIDHGANATDRCAMRHPFTKMV